MTGTIPSLKSRSGWRFRAAAAFAVVFAATLAGGLLAQAQTKGDRDLGKEAVALVEDISGAPKAGVDVMDYVYPQQTVSLGAKGKLVLSYLNGCMTDTITGGTVTVAAAGSVVQGGKMSRKQEKCPKQIVVASTSGASEAGASANRIVTFPDMNWSEQVLKSTLPFFKWVGATGASHVEVYAMDNKDGPVKIWEATTPKSYVQYPKAATKIEPGMPYKVQVKLADGAYLSADFSVDKGQDLPDVLANRVVRLQP